MKTTIISILLTIFSLSLFAGTIKDKELTDYVLTEQGIVYVKSLRYGINCYLIGKTEKGDKLSFFKKEILSYRIKGKVYSKKKEIINGKECKGCIFMEKLFTRAGYTIYKYDKYIMNNYKVTEFFIYYGEDFELQLNSENFQVVLSFFFPVLNELYSA